MLDLYPISVDTVAKLSIREHEQEQMHAQKTQAQASASRSPGQQGTLAEATRLCPLHSLSLSRFCPATNTEICERCVGLQEHTEHGCDQAPSMPAQAPGTVSVDVREAEWRRRFNGTLVKAERDILAAQQTIETQRAEAHKTMAGLFSVLVNQAILTRHRIAARIRDASAASTRKLEALRQAVEENKDALQSGDCSEEAFNRLLVSPCVLTPNVPQRLFALKPPEFFHVDKLQTACVVNPIFQEYRLTPLQPKRTKGDRLCPMQAGISALLILH